MSHTKVRRMYAHINCSTLLFEFILIRNKMIRFIQIALFVFTSVISTAEDIHGDPRFVRSFLFVLFIFLKTFVQAGPLPPFPVQSQSNPGLESQMIPKPDFGYTSYKGTGKLQGKIAIITGGDSGIGRAVALAFAREGASVVISYLNETEDAEEIQRIIQAEGHECLLIVRICYSIRLI